MDIDINCDLGESFGAYRIGNDEAMMKYITSANVACGLHAGDPMVMDRTVQLAIEHGVALGCHPGYPDLQGYGRRAMALSSAEIENYVLYQIGALSAFARSHGAQLSHVFAHGALGNTSAADLEVARAVARAIARFSKELIMLCVARSEQVTAGRELGLRIAETVSIDRAYNADGTLVSRRLPGAVLHDPKEIVERAIRLVREGVITSVTGEPVTFKIHTITLHGDNPEAAENAAMLIDALKAAGIQTKPMTQLV